MDKLKITLKTFFGLENVLKEELAELGYSDVEIQNRAVQLVGTWKDVYFLNLHARCAINVLVELKKFRINEENDLYKECMKIKWNTFFDSSKTFAIRGAVHSRIFSHSQYPFLLVKDAIVDTFTKEENKRPDVNTKAPQVAFDLYIKENFVTISLNTSGVPLFQRGYRTETGDAPLNEVLAAGMIRLSGWNRKSTFVDPFCGSGTLLIEAAFLAANIPSNIERQHYAFKNFKSYDEALWHEVYQSANKRCSELDFEILGSDKDAEMVTIARRNLRGLPIHKLITIKTASFDELTQPEKGGVLISNPPYGERIGDRVEEMYGELGDWFKKEMKGFDCWVISSNEDALKNIGLKPDKKIKLFNGDLECSFRKYRIFEGSHRDFVINKLENNK
jgi:putative N6-adenine-specific DNA methylase